MPVRRYYTQHRLPEADSWLKPTDCEQPKSYSLAKPPASTANPRPKPQSKMALCEPGRYPTDPCLHNHTALASWASLHNTTALTENKSPEQLTSSCNTVTPTGMMALPNLRISARLPLRTSSPEHMAICEPSSRNNTDAILQAHVCLTTSFLAKSAQAAGLKIHDTLSVA